MKTTSILLGVIATIAGGCTLAPRYERPAAPVPTAWPSPTSAASGAAATLPDWQTFIGDARLREIVRLALANNRDLRVAVLTVERVRAQYRIQRASLLPAITASGTQSRSRTPADVAGAAAPVLSQTDEVSVGVTAYELDLFGRVRSLKAQALETYLAQEETQRSTQLTLVAEVATQYLTREALARQLQVAEDTLRAVTKSRDLNRRVFEIGQASELDFQTAEAQVQSARGDVASYRQQLAAADTALTLLVGESLPATLPPAVAFDQTGLAAVPAPDLPSVVLLRRPDILAAEHTLKAAQANIGAARAAFFPQISLTGSFGTASTELSGLFRPEARSWSFVPTVTLPIFAGGSNRAALDVTVLTQRIEVANYEKAIQTAFKEVADALEAQTALQERLAAGEALVAAQQRRSELAEVRYRQGVDSYLTVLTAQQSLYSAQQTLISLQLARFTNAVTLYQVLGGGWSQTVSATTPARH